MPLNVGFGAIELLSPLRVKGDTTMTRPATHEEYLARLVPPSVRGVDRRTLLRASVVKSQVSIV